MKVLLFTQIYDSGGIDTFIINLINNWPNEKDSFVLISNSDYPGLNVIEEKLNCPCEIIRHKKITFDNLFSDFKLLYKAKNYVAPFFKYCLIFFNIFNFRRILLQPKADVLMVINGGYPGGDSCISAAISWGLFSGKKRSIHNFHNMAQKPVFYNYLQEITIDLLVKRYTNKFITVSSAAEKSMLSRSHVIKKENTSFIHNGLSPIKDEFIQEKNIRDEIGISKNTPLCLMLGTYEPRKGHHFLFLAFKEILKKIPDANLLICGFGLSEEMEFVEELSKKIGLKGFTHLMNFRTDTSNLISNSDVLLVASQSYESFGFTSVEAMSHKIPIVATDVGGIPEVVINGEGGYCVKSNDVNLFANKVISLLQSKELRIEQGERGYRRYRHHFEASTMSKKYCDKLTELKNS